MLRTYVATYVCRDFQRHPARGIDGGQVQGPVLGCVTDGVVAPSTPTITTPL
jgi:hypothetical protein